MIFKGFADNPVMNKQVVLNFESECSVSNIDTVSGLLNRVIM